MKLINGELVDFESWIENHWPKDVPHDCSKLNDYEQDCIATQDHREGKYCPSCTTYLVRRFRHADGSSARNPSFICTIWKKRSARGLKLIFCIISSLGNVSCV